MKRVFFSTVLSLVAFMASGQSDLYFPLAYSDSLYTSKSDTSALSAIIKDEIAFAIKSDIDDESSAIELIKKINFFRDYGLSNGDEYYKLLNRFSSQIISNDKLRKVEASIDLLKAKFYLGQKLVDKSKSFHNQAFEKLNAEDDASSSLWYDLYLTGSQLYRLGRDRAKAESYIDLSFDFVQKNGLSGTLKEATVYSNYGNILWFFKETEKADSIYDVGYTLARKVLEENSQEMVPFYANKALIHHVLGRSDKSKDLIQKTVKILRSNDRLLPGQISIYGNYSSTLRSQFEVQKSIDLELERKGIIQKLFGKTSPALGGVYHNLGSSYTKLNQFDKGVENYLRALKFDKQHIEINGEPVIKLYSEIAYLFRLKKDRKSADFYFNEAIELMDSRPDLFRKSWAACYVLKEYAVFLSQGNDKVATLNVLQKGLQRLDKLYPYDHVNRSYYYSAQAFSLSNLGMQNEAIEIHKQNAKLLERLNTGFATLLFSYASISTLYYKNDDFEAAYAFAKKGFETFHKLPESKQHGQIMNYLLDCYEIATDVKMEYYNQTMDPNNLEQCLSLYKKAFRYFKKHRKANLDEYGGQYIQSEYNRFLEGGFEAFLLNYDRNSEVSNLETAFTFLKSIQNPLLTATLAQQNSQNYHGLEKEQYESLKTLRGLSHRLQVKFEQTEKSELNYSAIEDSLLSISDQLRNLEEKLVHENEHFANSDPFAIDYSLEQVQALLSDDQVLVSYQKFNNYIDALIISKDKISVNQLKWNENYQASFDKYCSSIRSSESIILPEEITFFQTFKNHFGALKYSYKNIIIIPDEDLYNLPFELLNLQKGDSISDVLDSFNISYSPSIVSWATNREFVKSKPAKFIGFSPAYGSFPIATVDTSQDKTLALLVRSGDYNLAGAQRELLEINKILNGQSLVDGDATVDEFIKVKDQFNVFHFAMHGIVDLENYLDSYLWFSETMDSNSSKLKVSDINALNFDAQLVTLSACNTGVGEYKTGEGVYSIARAFTQAGVQSTVLSLWKVPDQATSEIMISFYSYLGQGKRKDEALRQAKLDYIKNVEVPELAHPYYWAGFILNGNTSPLEFASFNWLWGLVTICLLIAILGYWFFYKTADSAY